MVDVQKPGFMESLLEYCGECVRDGYMQPFELKHKDPRRVNSMLRNSPSQKSMCDSYDRMLDNVKKYNPFIRSKDVGSKENNGV